MERFRKIRRNKKEYMELLLEADPAEEMIDQYLADGALFILEEDGRLLAAAVVVMLGEQECELKNLAVAETVRKRGYGRKMVEYLCGLYRKTCCRMYVGTADVPCGCMDFYRTLGFRYTHTVKGFFSQYPEPVYEKGMLVTDMAYFVKELS